MLRRLSVLGTLLLTACVPSLGPGSLTTTIDCFNKPPTKAESAAWRSAQRVNTAKAYRRFINSYPRSCYVPAATAKISAPTQKPPSFLRNIVGGGSAAAGRGGRGGY